MGFNNDNYRALETFIKALGFEPGETLLVAVDQSDFITVQTRAPKSLVSSGASSVTHTIPFRYNAPEETTP